jgi:hypothetical protein
MAFHKRRDIAVPGGSTLNVGSPVDLITKRAEGRFMTHVEPSTPPRQVPLQADLRP